MSTLDPLRWKALFVIAIAQLMVILDATIVNIALPSIQADLGISDADRQWVVSLVAFAAASAVGGLAANAGLLYAARGLQGVSAAVLAPAALALISVTFTDSKERAKAFAVYGALSGGGAAIGLVLGGALTEFASWRWTLWINVPIALLAIALAIPFVRESRTEARTGYDVPGAVTVTLGLLAIIFGITRAESEGWTGTSTLVFLGVGLVLLAIFVVIELSLIHI